MSEAAQIILARQGDQTAWVAIVRQHQTAIFRFAWLLLGDRDEAEDVAQETFLRAFRALDTFEDERPLRPWLLQIAKNLAANRHRSLRRYINALGRWFQARASVEGGPPFDYAQFAATDELWRAVRTLDPPDQEIIYLRYFLELSVAESAEALNIAPGTVKSRLARALGRLRGVIAQNDPNWGEEGAQ